MKYIIRYFCLIIFLVLVVNCKKDEENIPDTTTEEDGTETTTEENSTDENTVVSENKKNVGDSANDLLSASTFEKLFLEIFYVDGYKPTDATIESFTEFLEDRLNKPTGIEISLTEITSPDKSVFTIDEVRALEDNIRTKFNDETTIYVFGVFLDGEYSENTENGSVLGVAYRNTSFVIFEETIKEFSGKPFSPSTTTLETAVLNHEFGHLLGLVNAGTTPQSEHQDEAHGRHCTTENCLMYWTAETGEGLLNSISGGTIPVLDSFCLEDLKANGGK